MSVRRAGFISKLIDESEQSRLFFSCDFDVIDRVAMLDEEQCLLYEDCEECVACTSNQSPKRIPAMGQTDKQTIARPAEPARQREIQCNEECESCHRKPRMHAIRRRCPGQIGRYMARTRWIDQFLGHWLSTHEIAERQTLLLHAQGAVSPGAHIDHRMQRSSASDPTEIARRPVTRR